jgi:hypothetical protein
MQLGETLDPSQCESGGTTLINTKFKNYNRNVSPLILNRAKKAMIENAAYSKQSL